MDNKALRRGNASLALLHAAQAAVVLAFSTDFSLPVTGAFMNSSPGSGLPKQVLLFDLRLGPLVGAFLGVGRARMPPTARGFANSRGFVFVDESAGRSDVGRWGEGDQRRGRPGTRPIL